MVYFLVHFTLSLILKFLQLHLSAVFFVSMMKVSVSLRDFDKSIFPIQEPIDLNFASTFEVRPICLWHHFVWNLD